MSKLILFTVILVSTSCLVFASSDSTNQIRKRRFIQKTEPSSNLVVEFAQDSNYNAEEHFVKTPDKYILRLDRIRGHPRKGADEGKVVLLMPATLGTSFSYVASGPDYALAFLLADRGYDVWMGNFRGNPYSRNHTKLNPDISKKFWQFSYDEMAANDLPALFNFVIDMTGVNKIFYIGFDAGARTFMMRAGSKQNDLTKRTALFVSLATTDSWNHALNDMDPTSGSMLGKIWKVAEPLGFWEVMGKHPVYTQISEAACGSTKIARKICLKGLSKALGDTPVVTRLKWEPKRDLPEHLEAIVGGTSIRTLSHVSQLINGDFRKFNFGLLGNLKNYFKFEPPTYDLGRLSCPTAVYWSEGDVETPQEDIDRVLDSLPNIVRSHRVKSSTFSHMDFLYSKEARKLLYKDILNVMQNVMKMNRRLNDSEEDESIEEESIEEESVET